MNTKFWQNNKIAVNTSSYEQILNKNNVTECLFLGYSPVIPALSKKLKIDVVCDPVLKSLIPDCDTFDNVDDVQRQYNCIIAPDEYFTNFATEELQKEALSKARDRTSLLITTLQDYKNLSPHKQAAQILDDTNIIVQKNLINIRDSQQWKQWIYVLDARTLTYGPITRRTLYFKQFARYCKDLGATEFVIDKTVMWQGNFGKTHEHWILARFL